ncbi:hypothetical protein SEVIR_4G097900v4 [Setaria viridis]|uniref:GST N-terminal domain-containing protein n=1 Tax=Setaria viridis TaxID=4556 RepID=A0A4U6UYA5_SETVI|nr:glutathione S-transferase U10-like [Setaria viridis]TKW20575.1 hypothetical protein SEVIR_4G097900v2 [Setaria viridis]
MATATEPREVKVYGAWGSAHAAMARNALVLKGVPYEYVEDDLDNKSETLLRLNPVHGGKVPVLVVDGRPLAESLVIIEYVDEAWPKARGYPPALLPREPPARAAARFWARFFHDEVSPLSRAVVLADAEAERAELAREVKARMAVMEAGVAEDFRGGDGEDDGPFVHGRSPGLLDVILGSCAAGIRVLSAVSRVEIVEPGAMPRVHASVAAFDELAAGFGTTVPHELLLARLLERKARSRAAAATASRVRA